MRAVLRLLWIYFTGSALGRRISAVTALLFSSALVVAFFFPEWGLMFQTGYMPDASLALVLVVTAVPVLTILGLFFGTFMLPLVIGQLSTTRRLHALPNGRAIVLSSAFACVTLIAFAFTFLMLSPLPAPYREGLYLREFSGALVGFTLLYVALWFVVQSRTAFGKLTSSMLFIAVLSIPAVLAPHIGVAERLATALVLWTAIALWVGRFDPARGRFDRLVTRLLSPGIASATRQDSPTNGPDTQPATRVSEHRRLDALVGTANPWVLALAQIVPFLIALLFVRDPEGLLFYLALFAVLTGAVASLAARRSRALWLRAHWTRDEIFAHLERSFWRQNRYALLWLAAAHISICAYFSLPLRTVTLGLPLLGLGIAASTYLGFMTTRRIGWVEIPLVLAAMLLVMYMAMSIPDGRTPDAVIVAVELGLLAAAFSFRQLARRRWHRIDWALVGPAPEHA
jgi:hypothetical protein